MGHHHSKPPPTYSVQNNNLLNNMWPLVNGRVTASTTVSGIPDPAYGCGKSFVGAYRCGRGPEKGVSASAEAGGKVISFDCSTESVQCHGKLEIDDSGNITLYDGNGRSLWQSNTNNVGLPVPAFKADRGKYGRNYMVQGETLAPGEFIGSPSGNCRMVVRVDGNDITLGVEYSYLGCGDPASPTDAEGSYGMAGNSPGNYGLYEMPTENRGAVGWVAHTSDEGTFYQVPDNLQSPGDQYLRVPGNYDSTGNDISQVPGSSAADCMPACTADPNCAGFVFNQKAGQCFLKNKAMYPEGVRTPNDQGAIYIRAKKVDSDNSCPKETKQIDQQTLIGMNYGGMFQKDQKCLMAKYIEPQQALVEEKYKKLVAASQTLKGDMTRLSSSGDQLDQAILRNIQATEDHVKEYSRLRGQRVKVENQVVSSSGQEDDSHLDLISQSNHYLLFTLAAILAVGAGIKASS